MAIEYGKIVYVGTDAGVQDYIHSNTFVVNAGQFMILPGFHDVHQHPLEAGSEVEGTCSLPINTAPDSLEMIAALQKCAGKATDQKGERHTYIFPVPA
jgi:predicted amidohydrolase YtcJ